MELAWAM